MRTKLAVFHSYADGTFRTEYGVQVHFRGRWAFLGDGDSIFRGSKEAAEQKRKELRKEHWT